jgi:hypothetical protein
MKNSLLKSERWHFGDAFACNSVLPVLFVKRLKRFHTPDGVAIMVDDRKDNVSVTARACVAVRRICLY